jgi:DNA-directed RNA polymerase subunit L
MDYVTQIVDWLSEHKSSTLPAWLKRNPIILDRLLSDTDGYQVKNVMERVYIVINSRTQPQCEFGNPKQFNTFELGYRKGCVKGNKCPCVSKHRTETQKQTLLSKYGTTSVSTIPGIVEKRRKTNLARYGVAHPSQTESNRDAAKHRVLNRSDQQKITIKEKSKKTSEFKYGVSHHMKNKTQKQKLEKSNTAKYGVKSPLQNSSIKEKLKHNIAMRSNEQRYQTQQIKQKTLLERFNVEHPSQINLPFEVVSILTDKDRFVEFISGKTRDQVVDELGIHQHTLYLRAKQYQVTDLFKKPIRSQFEQEVFDFISTFANAEFSNRKILNGKELDIYIPEKNLAIECCGLYWHSEKSVGRGRAYHSDKFKECRDR